MSDGIKIDESLYYDNSKQRITRVIGQEFENYYDLSSTDVILLELILELKEKVDSLEKQLSKGD